MEPTDRPDVDSTLSGSTADDDNKPGVQNGPTDTSEEAEAVEADSLQQCNGLEEDDADSDTEIEAAYNAAGTVLNKGVDQEQSEDWETEINTPCYVVPSNTFLYGKNVFVPSDIHAISTRRKTPWFQAVEGQFDDAEDS